MWTYHGDSHVFYCEAKRNGTNGEGKESGGSAPAYPALRDGELHSRERMQKVKTVRSKIL